MDEREQQRTARHRLAVLRHAEQVTGDVAATCRYYGISRRCFYQWKRRYDELGEAACETVQVAEGVRPRR
jgi:transposase